jgi:hypothetical protein
MGSWPSVGRAPEVAELSSISVLGSACGAGGITVPCAGKPGCAPEFFWPALAGCWPDGCVPAGVPDVGAVEGCVRGGEAVFVPVAEGCALDGCVLDAGEPEG